MVTLLSFVLLTQWFTFTQKQVTPPVEVLAIEVFAREYKGTNPRDPRMNQSPPGPVTAQSIPGVRPSKESIEKPKIEDRSRELRQAGSQARRESAPVRHPGGFTFEYRVKLKNTSPKKTKAILWEYQLLDSSATEILARRLFVCGASIKSSSDKVLHGVIFGPPTRVVSADPAKEESTQKQRVQVNRIEYSDGSMWVREGWKQEGVTRPDFITYGSKLNDGSCVSL
jgi:hypothetical protein